MISCAGLTRVFGTAAVVDGLTFDLPRGSICVFLGPNGAGKSTTVKLLTGALPPSSGTAKVAGLSLTSREDVARLKWLIGVLPERLGLFDHLSVEEHLLMIGPIYGLSQIETKSRTVQLLRLLGLESARYTMADRASHGTRKKVALALALLHNPQVLFLDEPFEGLDPGAARKIAALLQSLAQRGVTIFFTSHILSIAEQIATHHLFIQRGRILSNMAMEAASTSLEALYFDLAEEPAPEDLAWLGSRLS